MSKDNPAGYLAMLKLSLKHHGLSRAVVNILAARYLMTEHDRALLPDWVACLANGDIDNALEVRSVALAEMEVES